MRRFITKSIYIIVLISGIYSVGNMFLGSYVFFKGEGLVVAKTAVIASEFNTTVKEINVKEGQEVKKDDVLASVSSSYFLETQAKLVNDAANRFISFNNLNSRKKIIISILNSANERETITNDSQQLLEDIQKRGYLPAITRNAAIDQAFKAKQEATMLKAELESINEQLSNLFNVLEKANDALDNFVKLYNNGDLQAPVTGTISTVLVHPGSVVKAGDPIIEIVEPHKYILAYIPLERLYNFYEGKKITINSGNKTYEGYISKIMPLANALPKEFQKSFAPVDRQQLIKIEFDNREDLPPYFSKVWVK